MHLLNKHINTKQNISPTVTNGSLLGNDIAGVVSFTSTASAGIQTTVTFRFPYKVAPVILLTPRNMNAAVNNIGYYVTSTTTGFSINAAYTRGPINYEISYMAIQAE